MQLSNNVHFMTFQVEWCGNVIDQLMGQGTGQQIQAVFNGLPDLQHAVI